MKSFFVITQLGDNDYSREETVVDLSVNSFDFSQFPGKEKLILIKEELAKTDPDVFGNKNFRILGIFVL